MRGEERTKRPNLKSVSVVGYCLLGCLFNTVHFEAMGGMTVTDARSIEEDHKYRTRRVSNGAYFSRPFNHDDYDHSGNACRTVAFSAGSN